VNSSTSSQISCDILKYFEQSNFVWILTVLTGIRHSSVDNIRFFLFLTEFHQNLLCLQVFPANNVSEISGGNDSLLQPPLQPHTDPDTADSHCSYKLQLPRPHCSPHCNSQCSPTLQTHTEALHCSPTMQTNITAPQCRLTLQTHTAALHCSPTMQTNTTSPQCRLTLHPHNAH
jgi:hypothetical protein